MLRPTRNCWFITTIITVILQQTVGVKAVQLRSVSTLKLMHLTSCSWFASALYLSFASSVYNHRLRTANKNLVQVWVMDYNNCSDLSRYGKNIGRNGAWMAIQLDAAGVDGNSILPNIDVQYTILNACTRLYGQAAFFRITSSARYPVQIGFIAIFILNFALNGTDDAPPFSIHNATAVISHGSIALLSQ